jgi:hypothetical protein
MRTMTITDRSDHDRLIDHGQAFVNLDSGDSYSGYVLITPNWVTIQQTDSKYTLPREAVEFVNWKHVDDSLDNLEPQ